MKRLLIISALTAWTLSAVRAQFTPVSQLEKLDRGVVALPNQSSRP